MRTKQEPGSRELDYRLSKWILKNVEQLLTPDEVEKIWTELLSHYSPPTASIENVCGFTDNPLGKYQNPTWKEGDPHAYSQDDSCPFTGFVSHPTRRGWWE